MVFSTHMLVGTAVGVNGVSRGPTDAGDSGAGAMPGTWVRLVGVGREGTGTVAVPGRGGRGHAGVLQGGTSLRVACVGRRSPTGGEDMETVAPSNP